MFKRFINPRVILIHDTDIKNPFNANDFVHWMNQVVYLVDIDYEGPSNAYANALIDDPKKYNGYNDLIYKMCEQFTYLCGKLKQQGLPVFLPDYKSFLDRYEIIKTYTTNNLVFQAIKTEVSDLQESFKYCIEQNIATAKKHNIPLSKN